MWQQAFKKICQVDMVKKEGKVDIGKEEEKQG